MHGLSELSLMCVVPVGVSTVEYYRAIYTKLHTAVSDFVSIISAVYGNYGFYVVEKGYLKSIV